MRAALLFTVLAVAVPIREDPTPRQDKPLEERILGDWRIDNGPADGVLRVLRFTRTDMLILVDGKPWHEDAYSGPFTIDVAKDPVTFDIQRNKYKGVLKLEGENQLIVCLSLGGERPTGVGPDQAANRLVLSRIKY